MTDMQDYYQPKYLRGAIEKATPPRTFFRSRFFSRGITFPTEAVSFEFSKSKRILLPYADEYSVSAPIAREGYQLRTYRAPLITGSRTITPATLETKSFGELEWNSDKTPDERAKEVAARDLAELQDALFRKLEYMCARVKQDGKLTIDGSGVSGEVDYQVANIETVTNANKWTSTSYDILGKLAKMARVLRKNGVNPDMLIVGSDVSEAMCVNEGILKLRHDQWVNIPDPASLEPGIAFLMQIKAPGIYLNVYEYSEYYADENGNLVPVIDPDTVIMQSSKERNMMLHGTVTYLNPKTRDYVSSMSEYVPYVVAEEDPPVRKLVLSSRALPMPRDNESWYVLKNVA